ncbi:hypothetical protein DT075_16715 [Bacillus licheniformis]|nr:hypothetical protein DT075_16715 [Bacillus licheniformis]
MASLSLLGGAEMYAIIQTGGKQIKVEEGHTVCAEQQIYEVMLMFKRGCKHPIIIEKDGQKLSQLDENEVLHAYFTDKRTTSSMEDLLLVY